MCINRVTFHIIVFAFDICYADLFLCPLSALANTNRYTSVLFTNYTFGHDLFFLAYHLFTLIISEVLKFQRIPLVHTVLVL